MKYKTFDEYCDEYLATAEYYATKRAWEARQVEIDELNEKLNLAIATLEKIADPRKRHKEPDKYTELGCVMNMADQALSAIKESDR